MMCFIEKGDLIRLDGDARKLQVLCEHGLVWITQPSHSEDLFVNSGGSVSISHRGRIVIYAFANATIRLLEENGNPARSRLFSKWRVSLPSRPRQRQRPVRGSNRGSHLPRFARTRTAWG